jgi:hypothetical protein
MTDSVADVRKLGGRFSPPAREFVEARLALIKSYVPTVGLLYGVDPALEEGRGSWSVAAYAQETVADLVNFYGRFGAKVCFELDGMRVVIAQIGHLKQLDSGLLELRHNRLWPEPSA